MAGLSAKLMHRPKRIGLFSGPKLLIQRLRGSGPVHAWLDDSGLIAGTYAYSRPTRKFRATPR